MLYIWKDNIMLSKEELNKYKKLTGTMPDIQERLDLINENLTEYLNKLNATDFNYELENPEILNEKSCSLIVQIFHEQNKLLRETHGIIELLYNVLNENDDIFSRNRQLDIIESYSNKIIDDKNNFEKKYKSNIQKFKITKVKE